MERLARWAEWLEGQSDRYDWLKWMRGDWVASVHEFERVLFSEHFGDPTNGYRNYIDVDSFIDYHWMVEATKNIDGYWHSQFFYKDRGGKLVKGPIWDWDLSFGNVFYHDGFRTNGWRWSWIKGRSMRPS